MVVSCALFRAISNSLAHVAACESFASRSHLVTSIVVPSSESHLMIGWLRDHEVHAFLSSMPYKIAQKYMMDSIGYVPTICWLVVTSVLAIGVGGFVGSSAARALPDAVATLPASFATIATLLLSTAVFACYGYNRIRCKIDAASINGLIVVCPVCGIHNPDSTGVSCECGCKVRPFG